MSKVSLRRLLSRLTALALSTSAVGPAAAEPSRETTGRLGNDIEDEDADLDVSLTIDHEQLEARDAAAALGRSLALALGELRPLTATHLAATWSLSDDLLRRLAVAHALGGRSRWSATPSSSTTCRATPIPRSAPPRPAPRGPGGPLAAIRGSWRG